MRTFPVLAIAVALFAGLPLAAQAPQATTPCASVTAVTLVCGQQGPEDLYALPGGQWVVAGVYAGTGGVNLIRVSDRSSTLLYPSATAKRQYDAKAYPGCPGPPDAAAGA